jgi:hypothetical protein
MPRNAASRLAVILALSLLLVGIVSSNCAGAGSSVVLGSATFAKPYGEGWGTARPVRIYNGGDPSGLVKEIQWTSWGGRVAIGYGLGWIFKPAGGYYSRPVLVELRAQNIGRCGSQGAYTQLAIRTPSKPEASLGSWHLWSEAQSLCRFGF